MTGYWEVAVVMGFDFDSKIRYAAFEILREGMDRSFDFLICEVGHRHQEIGEIDNGNGDDLAEQAARTGAPIRASFPAVSQGANCPHGAEFFRHFC